MADANVDFTGFTGRGNGTCHGGHHPHPPFHDYPLLAWMHSGHPVHGHSVFTEDQKASVDQIATDYATSQDLEATALKFGTSAEHVRQAVAYSVKAGFLVVSP